MSNFSDNFNRADATTLGTPWTITNTAEFSITSNTAICSYSNLNPTHAWVDVGSGDVNVTVKVAVWDDWAYAGVIARQTDESNFIGHDVTVSGYRLLKRDSGSYTVLSSGSNKPNQGETMGLDCQGSALKTYINGSQVASVSDSFNSTAGHCGLTISASFPFRWDDFVVTDYNATGDTTAPVVASASTDGTSLTINFTESGSPPVLPASGVTGFTLQASGGAVTLSSTAISGTTYTATTSRTIYSVETTTLDYAPGNVTDSASPPNALASFTGTSVTNNGPDPPLTAGTASFVSSGPTTITVTSTAPSGGTGAGPTYQWECSADSGSYTDVTDATSLTLADATVSADGTLYKYRLKQTKGVDTVTTNAVPASGAIAYTGGAMTGGGPTYSAF